MSIVSLITLFDILFVLFQMYIILGVYPQIIHFGQYFSTTALGMS